MDFFHHLDQATTILRFLAAALTFLAAAGTAGWRVRRWMRRRTRSGRP